MAAADWLMGRGACVWNRDEPTEGTEGRGAAPESRAVSECVQLVHSGVPSSLR